MSRPDAEEPVPLLTAEERERETKGEPDLENDAGHTEPPKGQNLDHEYSVASTVKFAWLGTYFFFSLLLTLYNKLVLTMVSQLPPLRFSWLRVPLAWQMRLGLHRCRFFRF
jgi:hypothetical protein